MSDPQTDARPVLAVMGGSFDPPHVGHVMLPTYVLARGLARRVLVAPCWSHPFAKQLSPYNVRMAWTRQAMAIHGARVTVSDVERRLAQERPDGRPSFSIELLDALAREHPAWHVRLVFGSDISAKGEFVRWRAHERIAREYTPIVVPRAGYAEPELCALPEISSTAVRAWVAAEQRGEADTLTRRRLAASVPAAVLELIRRGRGDAGARSIWLIGHGHVATHAETWLQDRGWSVRVLSARALAAGAELVEASPGESPARPRGIWVLCRDPALPAVARGLRDALARTGLEAVPILHGAGALAAADERALRALAIAGHPVGTLHPICSLRRELTRSRLAAACFGVEGQGPARALALALIEGQPWLELNGLDGRARTTYHAACALAANHVAVLFADARALLLSQGHEAATVDVALAELLRSSLDNLVALGIPRGVTGPVSRGDAAAIAAHLEALSGERAALYKQLSARLGQVLRDAG